MIFRTHFVIVCPLQPRDRRRKPLRQVTLDLVNVSLGEQRVVLAKKVERPALVRELEFHSPDIARIGAAAIFEILDRDFDQCRGLVAAQSRQIQNRVAIRADLQVVRHIRAAELCKLLKHLSRCHNSGLRSLLVQFGEARSELLFFHQSAEAILRRMTRAFRVNLAVSAPTNLFGIGEVGERYRFMLRIW
jgi:hypothetical protein